MDSVENVTISKKTYQSLYNQVAKNLSFTIANLPVDEMMEIDKDLERENYWVNIETVDVLDCWSDFYFTKGRFPGIQELIMVPQAQIPPFVKTQTPLSPIDLYQNFKATDAKALISIQALAALNKHYGGNKTVSKNALTEFLQTLTFQALSKENDEIYLSFDYIGDLVLDILEGLAKKDQQSVDVAKTLYKNIKQVLDKTKFDLELPPELQIQEDLKQYLKKEKKPPTPPPRYTSTLLLTEKEINKTCDDIKED